MNEPAALDSVPGTETASVALPMTTVSFALTTAPAPMAEAKLIPSEPTSAPKPMTVLLLPVVLVVPAALPMKVLLVPDRVPVAGVAADEGVAGA